MNPDDRGQADRDVGEASLAECSVELEDEDGNPVRICQQNTGPGNQVGMGEFKPVAPPKDSGEAAREQAALDEELDQVPERP